MRNRLIMAAVLTSLSLAAVEGGPALAQAGAAPSSVNAVAPAHSAHSRSFPPASPATTFVATPLPLVAPGHIATTAPTRIVVVDPGTGFGSPTGSTVLTVAREFDKPAHNWLPGHRGVDLELAPGAPIYAPADGTVIYAGLLVDRHLVSIEYPGGYRTSFEPVAPSMKVGEPVRRGQVIGTLQPGHVDGASVVHWGVRLEREYIDPLSLVTRRELRLY